jgi:hypothetical protein
MEIKGKTEELLLKQCKNCERIMQEHTYSIKRPNLSIIDIEDEKR